VCEGKILRGDSFAEWQTKLTSVHGFEGVSGEAVSGRISIMVGRYSV